MVKPEKGQMSLIIESQKNACSIRGLGMMKKHDYLMFLIRAVAGICDIVQKQMPEEFDTFRGGVLLRLGDKEAFDRLAGVKESIMFDGTTKGHE